MPSHILLPIFFTPNAFSTGRSKHIDARYPIVAVNTSNDVPRQPLGVRTENGIIPMFP